MGASEDTVTQQPADEFTRSWRYRIGLGLIVGGHGVIVLGLLSPLIGVSAGIAGAMILGGELISLASVAVLGKDGFLAIKSKLLGFMKAGFAAPVGRTRHRVGIALLCTNALTTALLAAYAWAGFEATTPETPMPTVWGMDYADQASLVFWLFAIGELSFLIAIYVLGADWWDRFRSLFIWSEPRAETLNQQPGASARTSVATPGTSEGPPSA